MARALNDSKNDNEAEVMNDETDSIVERTNASLETPTSTNVIDDNDISHRPWYHGDVDGRTVDEQRAQNMGELSDVMFLIRPR